MGIKNSDIFTQKRYRHFDKNRHISWINKYVTNPENIYKHAFYPFILDKKVIKRFNNNAGEKVPKTRQIMFSSHVDRYIYQWYNSELNLLYNNFTKENGINKCSVAYRYNYGKNNINIANEVFGKILNMDNAYIIIGDFEKFFDFLDHNYLKLMLCKLLNVEKLPNDYYAVYKNITKYSFFNIEDLAIILNIKKDKFYRSKESISNEILRKHKKKYLKVNKNKYGIPQGSSISSVLSNIYMLNCDQIINSYVSARNGVYRRYSDDFIIAIPNINDNEFEKLKNFIDDTFKSNGNPKVEEKKTKIFKFVDNKLINITNEYTNIKQNPKNKIDYLGFEFDGKNIKICDRTISRFCYKMRKKIKTIAICKEVTKKNNKVSRKNLYKLYSKKGKNIGLGNFITYSEKADKIFSEIVSYKSFTKRCDKILKKNLKKMILKYKYINSGKYYSALKKNKKSI